MAIRIRTDGTMVCAAENDAEPGDTYMDDRLHHDLHGELRVLHTHDEGDTWVFGPPGGCSCCLAKRGIYGKYVVSKADGRPVAPEADYFVLRLDTDPQARHAARTYARNVEAENPELAMDLREKCDSYADRYALEMTAAVEAAEGGDGGQT